MKWEISVQVLPVIKVITIKGEQGITETTGRMILLQYIDFLFEKEQSKGRLLQRFLDITCGIQGGIFSFFQKGSGCYEYNRIPT